ncbi:DUF29 domain-containing protein [Gammaproteobacteria bacterium]
MQTIRYEQDVVAWANEQAGLLRTKRFDLLDWEHLADEIADVGKSEQRELASRIVVLLAHLLKWEYQPERRGTSWQITIRNQRRGIVRRLNSTPSLKRELENQEWWDAVWDDATAQAAQETGLSSFPEICPWTVTELFNPDWFPGS